VERVAIYNEVGVHYYKEISGKTNGKHEIVNIAT